MGKSKRHWEGQRHSSWGPHPEQLPSEGVRAWHAYSARICEERARRAGNLYSELRGWKESYYSNEPRVSTGKVKFRDLQTQYISFLSHFLFDFHAFYENSNPQQFIEGKPKFFDCLFVFTSRNNYY